MSSRDLHGARQERDLPKGSVGRISHCPGTSIALRSAHQPGPQNRQHRYDLQRRSPPDSRLGQNEILLEGWEARSSYLLSAKSVGWSDLFGGIGDLVATGLKHGAGGGHCLANVKFR